MASKPVAKTIASNSNDSPPLGVDAGLGDRRRSGLAQVDEADVGPVVGLVVAGVEAGPLGAEVVVGRAERLGDLGVVDDRADLVADEAGATCRSPRRWCRVSVNGCQLTPSIHRACHIASKRGECVPRRTTIECADLRRRARGRRSADWRPRRGRRRGRRGTRPCRSSATGPLWAGIEKFGVRWNTVSWSACSAMIGIDWMRRRAGADHGDALAGEVDAVVRPLLVKYTSPPKRSVPSMSGSFGTDRQPVAIT